jgi:uncharacterized protein involved in outer membrane biogenesis
MSRTVKALTFGLAGTLALLLAVPWLVPLAAFIPSVEAGASAALGQPVKIATLRLSLLPLEITASQVSSPLIEIARVKARPSWRHLLRDVPEVDEIELQGVRARIGFLRLLSSGSTSSSAPAVRVRRVVIKDAEVRFDTATLRSLQGVVILGNDAKVQEVRVQHQGERLRIVARPAGGGFDLAISARRWTVPIGPPIVFDRIEANARLTARGISTSDLSARLYGGTLAGPLAVNWRPDWSIVGELACDGVQLQPLAHVLTARAAVSGRLQAKPRFALQARDAAALIPSLRLETSFRVDDGLLQRVDLEAVARNPLARDVATGSTRFDNLAGRLEIDAEGYHFSALRVESGMLAATGEVSVSHDERLDGRIDAQLKSTGPFFAIPMRVSGTLHDPSIRPSRTAVAAAVAGSILLPGIGTAIGLKAGQLGDLLFGRRRAVRSDSATQASPQATPGRGTK